LHWTLGHRSITLLLGLGIFALSIFSATLLPSEFVPATDEGRASVSVELPPGSTLQDTQAVARSLSAQIVELSEVRNVFVDGGSCQGGITNAKLDIDLGPRGTRDQSAQVLQRVIEQKLKDTPDVKLTVLNAGGARDVQISVLGDNGDEVREAARHLAGEMRSLDTIRNVTTSASVTQPEIQITPISDIAAELGVTASALASTIRVATIDDAGDNLAKLHATNGNWISRYG
jgi:multidrug efflux pump subunit AcrB